MQVNVALPRESMLLKLMLGIEPVNNERFHTFRSVRKYVAMIYFFIQRNYLKLC